jgi:hypothetical protein
MSMLAVYAILLVAFCALVQEVNAHGYLAVPSSRNALHEVYDKSPTTCPVPNTWYVDETSIFLSLHPFITHLLVLLCSVTTCPYPAWYARLHPVHWIIRDC